MKNLLTKIVNDCPFGERLSTCPMNKLVSKQTMVADIINNLEESVTEEIITHHRMCLGQRYSNFSRESYTEQNLYEMLAT